VWEKRSTVLSTLAANAAARRSAGPGRVSPWSALASNSMVRSFVVIEAAPSTLDEACTR
jgi:hypothetical protein